MNVMCALYCEGEKHWVRSLPLGHSCNHPSQESPGITEVMRCRLPAQCVQQDRQRLCGLGELHAWTLKFEFHKIFLHHKVFFFWFFFQAFSNVKCSQLEGWVENMDKWAIVDFPLQSEKAERQTPLSSDHLCEATSSTPARVLLFLAYQ